MKFSTALLVLTSIVAVSGVAVPQDLTTSLTKRDAVVDVSTFALSDLVGRAEDDEWEYVLYDAAKSGEQCGGAVIADNTGTDANPACAVFDRIAKCATVKAGVKLGFAYCDVVFQPNSCAGGNGEGGLAVVQPGGTVTVDVPDIKFVTVKCIANN